INGKIAYASQEPWLFAGSVRQNILFGRNMEQVRYNHVIEVCQLKRDFSLLPYGDKTIIGERGISLSGGQRARINLARAVYADADIYLMDDPLSAVDAHVGKCMFEKCINKYLGNKTRIVTHQLQYLHNVDRIIVLKNGTIQAEGLQYLYDSDILEAVDEMLPAFIDCLQIGIALLGIIIVVATANVWLLIPTVLIGIVFYYMRIFYLATSRSVKRLEGVSEYRKLIF
ncbi:PREDICTED: probable multidrug resistance-associated protein lethal(2)03659, partial [Trachymyrmex cornetzi]|uniref:probable multidrug resistance-associated protein lethal(2)03659 n=1 Tax=Trachymyrmex cornetzi TaxID=471704 RepID=UPI00084F5FB0